MGNGCAECRKSSKYSGTCAMCGRRWGQDAPEGVEASSPCPVGGLRGHSWIPLSGDASEAQCTLCHQRLLSEGSEQETGEIEAEPLSSHDVLEVLRAEMLILCERYNALGEQLKTVAELIYSEWKEANERAIIARILEMSPTDLREFLGPELFEALATRGRLVAEQAMREHDEGRRNGE